MAFYLFFVSPFAMAPNHTGVPDASVVVVQDKRLWKVS